MEKQYPCWKQLPGEILLNIFQFVATTQTPQYLYDIALVCKSWRVPAQSVLHSHVVINTTLQLESFHNFIKYNSHFGTLVKTLDLKMSTQENTLDILTNLLSNYLPNLEYLYEKQLRSYMPILNALLNFKLNHLKIIQSPGNNITRDELAHYASCAFLNRNQLQQVYITNTLDDYTEDINNPTLFKFKRLYDNLEQFGKLTEIKLRRRTDDGIKDLEYVVETCQSLRAINFDLLSSIDDDNDSIEKDDTIPLDTMSHYIPRSSITTLHGALSNLDNGKILLYIIQKFPDLQELVLDLEGTYLDDINILIQLLVYVSKMNKFSISRLGISRDDVNEALKNFWSITSKPGAENINIIHGESYFSNFESFNICKNKEKIGTCTTMKYITELDDRQPYLDFIEKNGNFIGNLTFNNFFWDPSSHSNALPKDFFVYILTHCPSLQILFIDDCDLSRIRLSNVNSGIRHSMEKIKLLHCDLENETIEELSTLLSEIKELEIIEAFFPKIEENYTVLKINMPQTKISRIILRGYNIIFMKIFVVIDEEYYYYRVEKNDINEITKEEYTQLKNDFEKEKEEELEKMRDELAQGGMFRFLDRREFAMENKSYYRHCSYICCQTKPKIEFI